MRTSQTPLRVTFGGGGSDLQPGGLCVSATIDKYVTITVTESFDPTYVLHYSQSEVVEHPSQIEHRILRETLTLLDVAPGILISTAADIPAGTGLGSSGAFTVGLLRALLPDAPKPTLARLACDLDLGQQDQWSAVYGGVNVFDFADGTIQPVETGDLDQHLELHYTGLRHDAPEAAMPAPRAALPVLEAPDDPEWVGKCLLDQWDRKLEHQPTEQHKTIDRLVRLGMEHGAYGGKLIGAGNGGFVLFATPTPLDLGVRKVPFRFSHEGARCL